MRTWGLIWIFIIQIAVAAPVAESSDQGWLDTGHSKVGYEVGLFAHHFDRKILNFFDYNSSDYEDINVYDAFSSLFKDEVFDDAYRKSSLWLRNTLGYDAQRGGFDNQVFFRLNLSLPKTADKLNLYVGADNEEDPEGREYLREIKQTMALSYFFLLDHNVRAVASTGIESFHNPYTRVKFWLPIHRDEWRYRVSQQFQYSVFDRFEEETNFIADKILGPTKFLRWHVGRKSEEQVDGMQYYAAVTYNKMHQSYRGYQVGTSMYGATKPKNEITTYALFSRYKQRFLRKWLFYEMEHRVEWRKPYSFKPGYIFLFSLETFFGG